MNLDNITPEQLKKLIDYRIKGREACKAWKAKHPDYNKEYSKEYNKKYFGAMKDQTLFCSCCKKDVKKNSYAKHWKGQFHLAQSGEAKTWNETKGTDGSPLTPPLY